MAYGAGLATSGFGAGRGGFGAGMGGGAFGAGYGPATAASFLPTDIAGLGGWYKADGTLWQDAARTTPVTANDDPVGAWDDASGNARHLVQSTAGSRPLYKTGIQNGKPALLWDGADDTIDYTTNVALSTTHTAIIAFKSSSYAASPGMFFGANVGNSYLLRVNVTPKYAYRDSSGSTATSDGTPHAEGSFGIVAVRRNGTNVQFFSNGSQNGTDQTLGANNAHNDDWRFGGPVVAFVGHILEALVYDTALSTTNRGLVESYLNTKYAIF